MIEIPSRLVNYKWTEVFYQLWLNCADSGRDPEALGRPVGCNGYHTIEDAIRHAREEWMAVNAERLYPARR